jgi:hypothetical protein
MKLNSNKKFSKFDAILTKSNEQLLCSNNKNHFIVKCVELCKKILI